MGRLDSQAPFVLPVDISLPFLVTFHLMEKKVLNGTFNCRRLLKKAARPRAWEL